MRWQSQSSECECVGWLRDKIELPESWKSERPSLEAGLPEPILRSTWQSCWEREGLLVSTYAGWYPALCLICISSPAAGRGSWSQAGRCKGRGDGDLLKESLEEMLGSQSNTCCLLRIKAREKESFMEERRTRQQRRSKAHCQGQLTATEWEWGSLKKT